LAVSPSQRIQGQECASDRNYVSDTAIVTITVERFEKLLRKIVAPPDIRLNQLCECLDWQLTDQQDVREKAYKGCIRKKLQNIRPRVFRPPVIV
jgi:hypothetical protein